MMAPFSPLQDASAGHRALLQFGAPHVFRVVEPFIDRIELGIHVSPQIGQAGVVNKYPHEYGDRGNTNGKGDLNGLIGHHCLQNTPCKARTRRVEAMPVWVAYPEMVTRVIGIILALAVLSSTAASAQQTPKDTFPSGRKVKILSVDQIEIKEADGRMEWALLLRYETKLKIIDAVRRNEEVDEIWTWLKVDAEHRKLTRALIEVTDSSDDTQAKNLYFKKQTDGSWSRRNPSAN